MTNISDQPGQNIVHFLFQNETAQYKGSHYKEWPLAYTPDSLLQLNLERSYRTIKSAIEEYSEVIALRVHLETVKGVQSGPSYFNHFIMDNFFVSLRRLLQERLEELPHYTPGSDSARLDYLWRGDHPPPGHSRTYYTMLIMNRAAFFGHDHNGDDLRQLKRQICTAWAEANRTTPERVVRLCLYPSNVPMLTSQNEPESLHALFEQASLLCRTSRHDLGIAAKLFGSSR